MTKVTMFFIDDVIWCLRDLTRKHPDSMFDEPFLGTLKHAHDKYGFKVQLNLFYRTDFFYGDDEFTLADVTADYKDEWEANSDWLKLAFHAKQEFPDYPYVNATYKTVKNNFDAIKREVVRFAGENTFSYKVCCNHWLPMSKAGCKALVDSGVKVLSATYGEKTPYNGDPNSLPYGHAMRLLNNRQPETGVFDRQTKDKAISNSICSHNHITQEVHDATLKNTSYYVDPETGLGFKRLCSGIVTNLFSTCEELVSAIELQKDRKYICIATHEQYFYPEYFAYQPNYAEKIYACCECLNKLGYTFINNEDLINY